MRAGEQLWSDKSQRADCPNFSMMIFSICVMIRDVVSWLASDPVLRRSELEHAEVSAANLQSYCCHDSSRGQCFYFCIVFVWHMFHLQMPVKFPNVLFLRFVCRASILPSKSLLVLISVSHIVVLCLV